MKYRCIKDFQVGTCDGDGFSTGKEVTIPVGSIWYDEGIDVMSTGEIHLDSDEHGWLEIYKSDLEEYFMEIE